VSRSLWALQYCWHLLYPYIRTLVQLAGLQQLGDDYLRRFVHRLLALLYLSRSRNSCYEGTECIIKSLFQYTIRTGLLATFWSVGSLISYGLKPQTEISLVFYLPLSKIYVNAFLASLNARESLREKSRISTHPPRGDPNETRLKTISFASCASQQVSAIAETSACSRMGEEDIEKVIAFKVCVDTESASEDLPHHTNKVRVEKPI